MSHDALSLVGTLRDHLASHDRPIVFLFGAGTSCAVNSAPVDPKTGLPIGYKPLIPAVIALTDACEKVVAGLGTKQEKVWAKLCSECVELRLNVNIETVLSRIRAKLEAIIVGDALDGLTRPEWEAVDSAVREKIAELANPSPLPDVLPHHKFTKWVRNTTRRQAVEIFTTNYDVLFEASFDQFRVPHFDGFVGSQSAYFSPESLEDDGLLPSATWIRFWKMHGSVTWSLATVGSETRFTRGLPRGTGELILPSHRKYDESRKQPYRSLMDRLGRVLAREDALLITCGFSFGDQHINAIILDALEQHPRTHLIACSYDEISEKDLVSQWATSRANVIYVGPNAGALIGRFAPWQATGVPPAQLHDTTGGLVTSDPASPDVVRLNVGDFNAFCEFLNSIGMNRSKQ